MGEMSVPITSAAGNSSAKSLNLRQRPCARKDKAWWVSVLHGPNPYGDWSACSLAHCFLSSMSRGGFLNLFLFLYPILSKASLVSPIVRQCIAPTPIAYLDIFFDWSEMDFAVP